MEKTKKSKRGLKVGLVLAVLGVLVILLVPLRCNNCSPKSGRDDSLEGTSVESDVAVQEAAAKAAQEDAKALADKEALAKSEAAKREAAIIAAQEAKATQETEEKAVKEMAAAKAAQEDAKASADKEALAKSEAAKREAAIVSAQEAKAAQEAEEKAAKEAAAKAEEEDAKASADREALARSEAAKREAAIISAQEAKAAQEAEEEAAKEAAVKAAQEDAKVSVDREALAKSEESRDKNSERKGGDLLIGALVEGNMATQKGWGMGMGITAGYEIAPGFALGIKGGYGNDFHGIHYFEGLIYGRYYLPFKKEETRIFVQVGIGGITVTEKNEPRDISGESMMVDMELGMRFLFSRFYLEPYIRGGYPVQLGFGLVFGYRIEMV
jgi:hypothetical protein